MYNLQLSECLHLLYHPIKSNGYSCVNPNRRRRKRRQATTVGPTSSMASVYDYEVVMVVPKDQATESVVQRVSVATSSTFQAAVQNSAPGSLIGQQEITSVIFQEGK